ncbi:TPA: hypothetical protein N0F65_008088 [Lagenidium giganteum]|uniref:WW domain-containing protein n=1 Tax=Lagenidium giganteum TaxID=4803 RepID=A0AAV2Z077_9STRA|nr:TPA: hypothetical protein N0F65_008088 [Lagenidium giganteum]
MSAAMPLKHVSIVDDLLGAVYLLALVLLAVSLELTRRQICKVYQLAFGLAAIWSCVVVGGMIDHQLTDEQLQRALYGSYLASHLAASYTYAPIGLGLVAAVILLVQLSTCSCDCCCLVGAKCASHHRCLSARLRSTASLYAACCLSLFLCIGVRLNVRLRESAIHPVGGTVHWTMLHSPFYLAVTHIGSVLLIELKLFLQHAERDCSAPSSIDGLGFHAAASAPSLPSPAVVEELTQPPLKSVPPSPRRLVDNASASHSFELPPRLAARAATKQQVGKATGAARPSSPVRRENNDGDVSSLISSDSDSDDSVLTPSFTRPSYQLQLPPKAVAPTSRSSSTSLSGYGSSPPSSPASTSSASSYSFSSMRQRPRTLSNTSSSTLALSSSDTDDFSTRQPQQPRRRPAVQSLSRASYSDTSAPAGLRRRAPTLQSSALSMKNVAVADPAPTAADPVWQHTAASEWVEYVDSASGSVYYYNATTGESRWQR